MFLYYTIISNIILEIDIISLSRHHSRDRHHKFVYIELNCIKYLLTYFQELQQTLDRTEGAIKNGHPETIATLGKQGTR